MSTSRTSKIVKAVLKTVASYHALSIREMMQKIRKRELCQPRQEVMYLLKEYTKLSLAAIGGVCMYSETGKPRDHATVLHGVKTINNLKDTDVVFCAELKEMQDQIESKISIGNMQQMRDKALEKRRSRYRTQRQGVKCRKVNL